MPLRKCTPRSPDVQIARDGFGRNKETMFIPLRFAQIELKPCVFKARDVVSLVRTCIRGKDEVDVDVDNRFGRETGDGGRDHVGDEEDSGSGCVDVYLFGAVLREGGEDTRVGNFEVGGPLRI